jgi:phenylpropionate dioxygenase-like ring-hydroxylating dioxygenase large terminal subunit
MSDFKATLAKSGGPVAEPWTPNYQQAPEARGGQMKQPYQDFGTQRLSDNQKYFDPEILRLEWERIFTKVWVMAGHLNDIPKEDDFMTVDYGRESFLIVRGQGEAVRAIYKVCQHRGTRLVTDDFGIARTFTCRFHSWVFANTGELRHIPGRETFREEVLCRDLDLNSVRVDVWRGWVFFTLDREAPPLDDFLGPRFRASMEAYEFPNFIRVYDVRQIWDVNWKAAYEAFIEGYHVTSIHPELCTFMDDYYVQQDSYENGNGRSIFPFMEPAQSYLRSTKGQIDGLNEEMKLFLRAAMVEEKDHPARWQDVKAAVIAGKRRNEKALGFDFSAFSDDQLVDDWNVQFWPFTTMNTHPEGVLLQRWWPDDRDPRKTHYSLQIYAMRGECVVPSYMPISPEADRTGAKVLPVTRLPGMGGPALGPVVQQDVDFIQVYQAGIESRGFKGANYGEHEIKNRQFYDEYYKYMNLQKR